MLLTPEELKEAIDYNSFLKSYIDKCPYCGNSPKYWALDEGTEDFCVIICCSRHKCQSRVGRSRSTTIRKLNTQEVFVLRSLL